MIKAFTDFSGQQFNSTSTSISTYIILIGFVVLIMVILQRLIFKPQLHYSQHNSILTKAELNFYHTLCNAVPYGCVLCPKVRIADVLQNNLKLSSNNRKKWYKAFSQISQKHFDFVICKNSDMSFVCAIELNDKSHQQSDRIERDRFVREICQSANLPLLEVLAAKRYDPLALAKAINRYL
ncbi:DUF2726 domain-containing protein [Photobacterium leiognathi]|uniref:DUF2726 domain-containing protein n=1 Tax=Photobacterium leiognathi TaxID=553611 RepID=UPI002981E03C|nr:DUF2726 domain-containing protein [Photobacterium leiognathi]